MDSEVRTKPSKAVLTYFLIFSVIFVSYAYFTQANTNIVNLEQQTDYYLEVAKGNILGSSPINKFGENGAVGTSFEDIWDYGGTYVYLPIGQPTRINITSSDTTDTFGGLGAWTVNIVGLDENYDEYEESINLNGQNPNTTIGEYIRVFRAVVTKTGNGDNAGNLYMSYNSGFTAGVPTNTSTILAMIQQNHGQTLMSQYTIPNGKTGYLLQGYATSAGNKNVQIQYRIRPFNSSNNVKFDFDLLNGNFIYNFAVPGGPLPEKTDMMVRANSDAGTTRVSTGFDLVVVDN